MSVIFVLLPLALLFAGAALATYVWAARSGQFDDLETPPLRVLHDDEDPVSREGGPPAPKPGAEPPGTKDRRS